MPATAIITGASSGIGFELAKVFAQEGYDLIITARRKERLKNLQTEIENDYNVKVHVIPLDITKEDNACRLLDYTEKNNLNITALVNNAGVGDYGSFHTSEWIRQSQIIELNIKALTHLTHLFLPALMKNERSYILNVASTAAFQPGPLMSVYYASKHYVLAFSEAIADELQGYRVTVTALCPGPTESEFQKVANMQTSKLIDRFPLATSHKVAEYGYKAMKKGKRVAVYGFYNKLLLKTIGLFPRSFVTAAVRKIKERK
ncbi:MAG: SDR family oxidoreductase [Balneolaceae bacterium]|nr:MAG: SDR family oxidoreductase [Balneolaceae bacterium]